MPRRDDNRDLEMNTLKGRVLLVLVSCVCSKHSAMKLSKTRRGGGRMQVLQQVRARFGQARGGIPKCVSDRFPFTFPTSSNFDDKRRAPWSSCAQMTHAPCI